MYKDSASKAKTSYLETLNKLESSIKFSEEALSGLGFENSDARKKIDNAWTIRWMAWESLGKAKVNLNHGEFYFNEQNYKKSYEKILEIDKHIDAVNSDLKAISKEISDGRQLEVDYQNKKKFCFLFWCEEKNQYEGLKLKLKDLELKIEEINKKKQELKTQSVEFTQKQQQLEITKQKTELQKKQAEIQKQEKIKQQQQAELERKQRELEEQERLRYQQQQEYESQIQQEKQTQLQILASTNPLLKKIMTGHITFWVEPLPPYAAPDVGYEVERVLDVFESWNGVSRVYNEGSADIKITWIRDFNPTTGGLYWQSYVQVGVGSSSGCYGKWQPFVAHTVRLILWHELGHAMGYGHSTNPNNIMYPYHEHYHYKEFDDDVFLNNGSWMGRSFCLDGEYTFSLSGNSKSEGFEFYVITPETDPKTFFDPDSNGRHYPDCHAKGEWTSYTMTCTVTKGSYLLVLNPYEIGGSAINVDVETSYVGGKRAYDMTWDPDVLRDTTEYLIYLNSLR